MLRSLHDTAVFRIPEKDSMQSQRWIRFLAWGTCRLERITSYFCLLSPFSKHFCLILLFLPSYLPFSCQASSSAFFNRASTLLCGHFHLFPSLVLIPSSRWRRVEEEHEGTCEDFQATTLGCLPAHKRCSLCSSAKSNVMQWGTTG